MSQSTIFNVSNICFLHSLGFSVVKRVSPLPHVADDLQRSYPLIQKNYESHGIHRLPEALLLLPAPPSNCLFVTIHYHIIGGIRRLPLLKECSLRDYCNILFALILLLLLLGMNIMQNVPKVF